MDTVMGMGMDTAMDTAMDTVMGMVMVMVTIVMINHRRKNHSQNDYLIRFKLYK